MTTKPTTAELIALADAWLSRHKGGADNYLRYDAQRILSSLRDRLAEIEAQSREPVAWRYEKAQSPNYIGEKSLPHAKRLLLDEPVQLAYAAPPQQSASVPDAMTYSMNVRPYVDGWNACRAEILAAAPKPD